jgi:type IV secretory pathway VirB2 component (pilin)
MIRRVLVVAAMVLLVIPFADRAANSAGPSFVVQKTMQLATGQLVAFDLTWVDQ